MTNPAIQNDFSYYRRTLSRMKMAGGDVSFILFLFLLDSLATLALHKFVNYLLIPTDLLTVSRFLIYTLEVSIC